MALAAAGFAAGALVPAGLGADCFTGTSAFLPRHDGRRAQPEGMLVNCSLLSINGGQPGARDAGCLYPAGAVPSAGGEASSTRPPSLATWQTRRLGRLLRDTATETTITCHELGLSKFRFVIGPAVTHTQFQGNLARTPDDKLTIINEHTRRT